MVEQRKGLVINATREVSGGHETVRFRITLGEKQNGKIFLPLNEEQLIALECFHKRYSPPEEGRSTVKVSHGERKISWEHFFPFGVRKTSLINGPKKMGVEPLVHYALIEYLARKCSLQEYEITHTGPTVERIRQLELMGINHLRRYPFPEYREIVRQAIVKRFGAEPKLEMP